MSFDNRNPLVPADPSGPTGGIPASVGWSHVPVVLIAATCEWVSAARLAMAFAEVGCRVETVCPPGNPAIGTRAVRRIHSYSGLAPLRALSAAIEASGPDLIVPCDDLAAKQLRDLHGRERRSSQPSASKLKLLERSLGDPDSYPIVETRNGLMTLAARHGIGVPQTAVVNTQAELKAWIEENGLPAVLKADGSSSGIGVRIVHTAAEAEHAFKILSAPPILARVAKRVVIDRDLTLLRPFLMRNRPVVNVQTYISGPDATSSVACWEGKVQAAINFKVVKAGKRNGPASVLKVIGNRDMSEAAETITRSLKLSGIVGFDFKLDERTGRAWLLEMNPRAPATCHLRLGAGRDLPAALAAVLAGAPPRLWPGITDNCVIAMFPQAWQQEPGSDFLRTGYHDVPWHEPHFVRECITRLPPERRWYSYANWAAFWSAGRVPDAERTGLPGVPEGFSPTSGQPLKTSVPDDSAGPDPAADDELSVSSFGQLRFESAFVTGGESTPTGLHLIGNRPVRADKDQLSGLPQALE